MRASTPTSDRILDAAMELFGEQGFRSTSITQIEARAGLATGSGGIYHHFSTKQAVLEAGVQRHLQRVRSLQDLRNIFSDLGNLRIELTIIARYALAALDRERSLLLIIATESRTNPELVGAASARLTGSIFDGFAGWLSDRTGTDIARSRALSAVAVGAIVSHRLLTSLNITAAPLVDDEQFVGAWVEMLTAATAS